MFKEFDVVRLKADLPERGLKAGEEGVVVMVHAKHKAYEVEFLEDDGCTKALVGLHPGQIIQFGNGSLNDLISLQTQYLLDIVVEGAFSSAFFQRTGM